MKSKVYLICGVSGSGKTWVCKQLQDKFTYIPHDEHYKDQVEAVLKASSPDKSVITECPFAERVLKQQMEEKGLDIIPLFVIVPAERVAKQYFAREGKGVAKNVYTRASTILNRAIEWSSFHGTAEEVLKKLKDIK